MSYTKGPWRVVDTFNSDTESGMCSICTDNEVWYIATIENTGSWEADASLISAAPDLYEALKAAISCGIVPSSSAREGGAMKYVTQARVADQIRYAIAKAEGRSNG